MGTKALIFEIIGVDKASGTFSKVSTAVTESTTRMEKMQRVGAMAGKALAIGAAAGAVGLFYAGKAAAEDEQAQAQLAQQLKQAAGATDAQVASTEAFVTASGKAFGVADDQLRPALSKLATATGDVDKAQKLASLSMNIAAGAQKDLGSVSQAVAKAYATGNVAALGKFGVATKDAAGKTKSLSEVTDELAKKYSGAAAKAADTTAGRQKILTVQLHELAEQIGAAVLPAMTAFANILIQAVGFLSQHTKAVGIAVGVLGGLLAVTWAIGTATKIWAAISKVAAAAQIIWTNAQWALNVAMEANPIGLLVVSIGLLIGALVLAYKHSSQFRAIVNAAFTAVKTVVLGAVEAIAKAVGWVIDFVRKHWALLFGILTGPVGLAVVLIVKHWQAIKDATRAAWDWVRTKVSTVIGDIVSFTRSIPGRIKGALSDLKTTVGNVFDNAMTAGKNKVETIAGAIMTFIRGIPGKITSAFSGIWNGLAGGLKSAINAVLHLPLVIPKINTHIPGVGTVGGQTLIPALAKGGIVTKPTLALIGEAGPEAVVPLGRGGIGEQTIVVNLNLDGKTIQQALLKVKRTNGGLELGLA